MASGQIYQYRDSQGNLYFTDKPTQGAQKIEVKEPEVIPVPVPAIPDPSETPMTVKPEVMINQANYYKNLAITSPIPDETIRNNIGLIDVNIEIQPELRGGDRVVLFLDGQNAGESLSARSFTLQNIDRGTHVIQFKILDAGGKQIGASEPVNVHVHRAHIGSENKFLKKPGVVMPTVKSSEGTVEALLKAMPKAER